MRKLIEIRADLHITLEKLHSLKTKKARIKLRDGKLRDLRKEASKAMSATFNRGDKITLDYEVCCTAPSGGGWGVRGTVEVLDVYNTSLAVVSGNQVLYIEILEDWKRWGSDSFFAFQTALKERNQDIDRESVQHSLETSQRLLRGTLSVRNHVSPITNKKFREGQRYQENLLQYINWVRGYKTALENLASQ